MCWCHGHGPLWGGGLRGRRYEGGHGDHVYPAIEPLKRPGEREPPLPSPQTSPHQWSMCPPLAAKQPELPLPSGYKAETYVPEHCGLLRSFGSIYLGVRPAPPVAAPLFSSCLQGVTETQPGHFGLFRSGCFAKILFNIKTVQWNHFSVGAGRLKPTEAQHLCVPSSARPAYLRPPPDGMWGWVLPLLP